MFLMRKRDDEAKASLAGIDRQASAQLLDTLVE
jgi:hypothetical protein